MSNKEFNEKMEQFITLTQENFNERMRSEGFDALATSIYENVFGIILGSMEGALFDMNREKEEQKVSCESECLQCEYYWADDLIECIPSCHWNSCYPDDMPPCEMHKENIPSNYYGN